LGVLSQNIQRQIDELNASPLFTEYQSILASRQAQRQARQAALSAITKSSLTELKSLARPTSGVESIGCLVTFIALRKKTKLCTWDEVRKALSIELMHSLASVEDEYLSLPKVQKHIREYLADPNNSLAKLRTMSNAAAVLFTLVETMLYQHADYERAHLQIQRDLRVYSRIEHLQTNPLPPSPAPRAQGKPPGKAKTSSATKPSNKK
jgi:hypothetical protein